MLHTRIPGIACCWLASSALGAPDYHVIVIGDLEGGDVFARPYAINDNGAVVGASIVRDSGQHHAFYWHPSVGMVDLADVNGLANSSAAYDINNQGDIVGFSSLRVNGFLRPKASVWGQDFAHTFAFDFTDLTRPQTSVFHAVNELGTAVGSASVSSGALRGAIWTDIHSGASGVLDPSADAVARDVNNGGYAVGHTGPLVPDTLTEVSLGGTPTTAAWLIGLPGTIGICSGYSCTQGIAETVTSQSTVYGSFWNSAFFGRRGFELRFGGEYDTYTPLVDFTRIMDANDREDLVGIDSDADIFLGGGFAVVEGDFHRPIDHLYADDGTWYRISPHAINNLGWIAARGNPAGTDQELAILLRPVGQCPA
ncbi:MAG: DUF3466 family protein, partial [Planctomycetota bacterium]